MEEENHGVECKKEERHFHHVSHHKESLTCKMRENPWVLATVVLGILSIILIIGSFSGGNIINKSAAGQAVLDFANSQVDGEVTLVGVDDYSDSLYEVTLGLDGQNIPLYVTKDGKDIFTNPIYSKKSGGSSSSTNSKPKPTEVPKSDKPLVELFVMTHCPYGTQAEKGLIPTIKELGNTVNANIRFVHYFMHGDKEEAETYNQVCIREEQSDKYLDYLACFLEDSDSARCAEKVGVDMAKVNDCISNGKAKEYYAEDSALSKQYGVQGSPTLVINGIQSNAGRDSESYLSGICGAFNTSPSECEAELSTSSPSPGFGYNPSNAGDSAAAQCA